MKTSINTSGQLGPFFKQLRTQRGLSQAALGKKIGLSQERISRIENHPEAITFDQVLTILMALGASLTAEAMPSPNKNEFIRSATDHLNDTQQDAW